MLNLKGDQHWSDNLRLGVFVQNLLNDRSFTGPSGFVHNAARARPQTYGIEFGVNLN
jgi:hypothetical protein